MMPKMPSAVESGALSSPLSGEEVEKSTSSFEDLSAPSHVRPLINTPEQEISSEVKIPLVPKKGIEVVATRKGFYNQMRYKEGDRFLIRNMDEFGDWFKCIDPVIEKKRVEFYKEKKKAK